MRKNIAVSKEVREKIAKVFKVTERHVYNALNLSYPETETVKRIRVMARHNGGVMMATVPAGESIWFADGTMRMDFDNGAFCEFQREDGSGRIVYKGEEVATYKDVDVPMIFRMKEQAEALG